MLRELQTNGTGMIRPAGGSMRGRIESDQMVTLLRTTPDELAIGDIALVRWRKK